MPIYRSVAVISSPSLGGNGTNTWHARTTGATPDNNSQLDEFTGSLEDFYTSIQARFAGGSTITHDGVWTRVDDDSGEINDRDGWSVGPSSGGNPLPPQDCLVVGWRAASGGRSGRGRTFIGPLAVSCLESNGTPDEAARTDLSDAADALIATFDSGLDGALVVWSPTDSVGRDIVSASIRNVFGTLRSRRD